MNLYNIEDFCAVLDLRTELERRRSRVGDLEQKALDFAIGLIDEKLRELPGDQYGKYYQEYRRRKTAETTS